MITIGVLLTFILLVLGSIYGELKLIRTKMGLLEIQQLANLEKVISKVFKDSAN